MFKKSLLQLLFWSSLSVFAQQTNEMPGFKAGADVVLKGISQYPVPSGILYNRVLPFSGINQSRPGQISEWSISRFIQAVHELEEASLQAPANPVAQTLLRTYERKSLQGEIHLLAFCTKAEIIDTSHLIDSSLRMQNRELRFFPRNGEVSPMASRELSAAALMHPGALIAGKEYEFFYPGNIKLGNQYRTIQAAAIRFGTGPWENLLQSASLKKSFTEPGRLTVSIRIEWEGGLREEYHNPMEITSGDACQNTDLFLRPDDCPSWFTEPEFAPSWPSAAIEASIAFEGLKGRAEVLHYMSNGNNSGPSNPSYRNPIIFVDGIDFGDLRKGEAIYGKYLSYLPSSGGNNSIRLGSQLRNQGHDIIILNFPDGNDPSNVLSGKANPGIDGGCDYIERNAMILVRLIQLVNQHLAPGSRKLSIAGASMGGVITRYALAYMEKNPQSTGNHKCGLFISMDSPQLGANIPVGLQFLLKNLSGLNFAEANQAFQYLKSPASTELLIQHVNRNGNPLHHANRTSFLQNCLNNSLPGSFGWPRDPDLRMVALSNGSSSGQPAMGSFQPPSSIQSSGEMLSFNARLAGLSVLTMIMAVYSGNLAILGSGAILASEFNLKTYYSPGFNGVAPVFRFNIRPGIFGQNVNILSQDYYWNAFDGSQGLDGAPGGMSATTGMLADGLREAFSQVPAVDFHMLHADRFHPFIPTKSALGFHWNSDGIRNPGENFSSRNLTCTGEIPFHAYYCATENESHIRLREQSVIFLQAQLNYLPPAGGIPYPAEIQGPKAVAAGSATEFSGVYQGNLEFRTSWAIHQTSGISASLSNAQSQTCKVLVSSGAGQENGYFILSLITEVKSLSGDWVCAGRRLQKVQVRKTAFMGNITWSCNPDLAVGCSFILHSGTPNYENLTNGVLHLGYEWQISKFQNNDFGNNCWNGALSIYPVSSNSPNIQKASVNLGSGFGTGNVFIYYARVRNLMKIPNPDYGQNGEPEFLTIGGAWKTVQLETEVLPGPGCAPCAGALVLEPENPIQELDEEVRVRLPESWSGMFSLKLYNASSEAVYEGECSSLETRLSLKEMLPGQYRIEIKNEAGEVLTGHFWLQPANGAGLMASPRIAIQGRDKLVNAAILDEHFTEGGNGQWQASLQNLRTGATIAWAGNLQTFSIPLSALETGSYELSLSNGLKTIKDQFELLGAEEEQIRIFPNPAENLVHITIPVGIQQEYGITLRISDFFGNVKLEKSLDGLETDADLSQLTPGLYVLHTISGMNVRQVWFRKN